MKNLNYCWCPDCLGWYSPPTLEAPSYHDCPHCGGCGGLSCGSSAFLYAFGGHYGNASDDNPAWVKSGNDGGFKIWGARIGYGFLNKELHFCRIPNCTGVLIPSDVNSDKGIKK